jgi:hypothetical protein
METLVPIKIEISSAVLSALSPQRSMLNANADDLIGERYILTDQMPGRNASDPKDLKTEHADSGQIKFKFRCAANSKSFVLSARQLMSLHHHTQDTVEDYDKAMEKATEEAGANEDPVVKFQPYYEILAKEIRDMGTPTTGDTPKAFHIPNDITVINVKTVTRVNPNDKGQKKGKEHDMYPAYMYRLFDEAANGLDDEERFELYSDSKLMDSLPGSLRLPRYEKADTSKHIKVHIAI